MRRIALVVVAATCLLPAGARAGVTECRRLTQQIEHFQRMAEEAEERDNELWEQRTREHVERLVERRKAQCPGFADGERAAMAFNELLKLAASYAVTFFTLGML
jgi:hypothetical protein